MPVSVVEGNERDGTGDRDDVDEAEGGGVAGMGFLLRAGLAVDDLRKRHEVGLRDESGLILYLYSGPNEFNICR